MLSLVYMEKLKSVDKTFKLTDMNVCKFFAVMMLVAAKFAEDEIITNDYWSDISGISMEELNLLEDEFCFKTEFRFLWI